MLLHVTICSSVLDFDSKLINKLYVAWRKAVRKLLKVPQRTHGYLLHGIENIVPVNVQLHKRLIRFTKLCV